MCDQTEVQYLPGEVVWVKLRALWWPGLVQDYDTLPEEITRSLRKRPIAIVKFFQEDSYEYVHKLDLIYRYNCSRKLDFIKKGLDLCRKKTADRPATMDFFPADVVTAEEMTNGDPNILQDEAFKPEEKPKIDSIFGSEKKKLGKKKGKEDSPLKEKLVRRKKLASKLQEMGWLSRGITANIIYPSPDTPRIITHRRFLNKVRNPDAKSDYEARIREQKCEDEPSSLSDTTYSCVMCGYVTCRLNVIVLHFNSTHSRRTKNLFPTPSIIRGGSYRTPLLKMKQSGKSTMHSKKKISMKVGKVKPEGNDVEPAEKEESETPQPTKKEKGKPGRKRKVKPEWKAQDTEEEDAKKPKVLDTLLADWEEDMEQEKEEQEREKHRQDDDEDDYELDATFDEESAISAPSSASKSKEVFEFVDDDDGTPEFDLSTNVKGFGRRIPRVIESSKDKKRGGSEAKKTPKTKGSKKEKDAVVDEFESLLAETSMPSIPSIPKSSNFSLDTDDDLAKEGSQSDDSGPKSVLKEQNEDSTKSTVQEKVDEEKGDEPKNSEPEVGLAVDSKIPPQEKVKTNTAKVTVQMVEDLAVSGSDAKEESAPSGNESKAKGKAGQTTSGGDHTYVSGTSGRKRRRSLLPLDKNDSQLDIMSMPVVMDDGFMVEEAPRVNKQPVLPQIAGAKVVSPPAPRRVGRPPKNGGVAAKKTKSSKKLKIDHPKQSRNKSPPHQSSKKSALHQSSKSPPQHRSAKSSPSHRSSKSSPSHQSSKISSPHQSPKSPSTHQGPKSPAPYQSPKSPPTYQGPKSPVLDQSPRSPICQPPKGSPHRHGSKSPSAHHSPKKNQAHQSPKSPIRASMSPETHRGPQSPQHYQGPKSPLILQSPKSPQPLGSPGQQSPKSPQSFQSPKSPQSFQSPKSPSMSFQTVLSPKSPQSVASLPSGMKIIKSPPQSPAKAVPVDSLLPGSKSPVRVLSPQGSPITHASLQAVSSKGISSKTPALSPLTKAGAHLKKTNTSSAVIVQSQPDLQPEACGIGKLMATPPLSLASSSSSTLKTIKVAMSNAPGSAPVVLGRVGTPVGAALGTQAATSTGTPAGTLAGTPAGTSAGTPAGTPGATQSPQPRRLIMVQGKGGNQKMVLTNEASQQLLQSGKKFMVITKGAGGKYVLSPQHQKLLAGGGKVTTTLGQVLTSKGSVVSSIAKLVTTKASTSGSSPGTSSTELSTEPPALVKTDSKKTFKIITSPQSKGNILLNTPGGKILVPVSSISSGSGVTTSSGSKQIILPVGAKNVIGGSGQKIILHMKSSPAKSSGTPSKAVQSGSPQVVQTLAPKTVHTISPKAVQPISPKTVIPITPKSIQPITPKTSQPMKVTLQQGIPQLQPLSSPSKGTKPKVVKGGVVKQTKSPGQPKTPRKNSALAKAMAQAAISPSTGLTTPVLLPATGPQKRNSGIVTSPVLKPVVAQVKPTKKVPLAAKPAPVETAPVTSMPGTVQVMTSVVPGLEPIQTIVPSIETSSTVSLPASNQQLVAVPTEDGGQVMYFIDNSSLLNLDGSNQANLGNLILTFDNMGQPTVSSAASDFTFAAPSSGQDILAQALADTQVLQSESSSGDLGLDPSGLLSSHSNSSIYPPTLSHGVLETSLTLNQPIMTPLEDLSAVSTLQPPPVSGAATSVELPITITQPDITISTSSYASLPIPSATIQSTVFSDSQHVSSFSSADPDAGSVFLETPTSESESLLTSDSMYGQSSEGASMPLLDG